MKTIGFIGTGVMGCSMAMHLLDKGYSLNVYNRTRSKTDQLVKNGALWRDTPQELAEKSDIILTIVGYPSDVENVYFGKDGLFSADLKGKILIDLTTSTPSLAKKIATHALQVGAVAFDAPVSGGDLGAQKGTLSAMVGGPLQFFEAVEPILSAFSKRVTYLGEAGAGQHTKMANQIMVAGTMTGLTELLVYAKAAQLDLFQVLEVVGASAAANWSLENYGPRILNQNFEPGFFAKHFLKDLKIALDEAEKMNIDLPATKEAYRLYQLLNELGYEEKGTQALINLWWGDKTQ
ncbi:NAD(P)-dependent oxidoreductase [Atopobacter phocae]|uniref:NAD(P)-dependent oxidoreductase n=1 Tax=Atopobacter phocae TaxID=136492 RepID=UPI0004727277|nr:NAD(P)-dependent oxidoreductase [Atopobacter phocae]